MHDLVKWNQLTVQGQEEVVGRSKEDNIEFSAADRQPYAHINKGKATAADGSETPMYRQNMPYGNSIENGTYFIGFAKSPEVIDSALRKMIIADSQGYYDHLLDYTRAVTGCDLFCATTEFYAAPELRNAHELTSGFGFRDARLSRQQKRSNSGPTSSFCNTAQTGWIGCQNCTLFRARS